MAVINEAEQDFPHNARRRNIAALRANQAVIDAGLVDGNNTKQLVPTLVHGGVHETYVSLPTMEEFHHFNDVK